MHDLRRLLLVLLPIIGCSHDVGDSSGFGHGGQHGADDQGDSTDAGFGDEGSSTSGGDADASASMSSDAGESSDTGTKADDGGGSGCNVDADCVHADVCTMGTCDLATGSCVFHDVVACVSGDGCCPAGCAGQGDDDCTCLNFAPEAVGSASHGSPAAEYGPANWLDGVNEAECVANGCSECYGWVGTEHPQGAWVRLDWDQPRKIGSMYIETSGALSGACTTWSVGPRNIEKGEIQYWNGQEWVTAHTFNNEQNNLAFDFNPPIETVSLRIDKVQPSAGQGTIIGDRSSLIFEWYTYEPTDCRPVLPPL